MQMFVSIKEMEIQIEMNISTNYFIMSDIKLKEQISYESEKELLEIFIHDVF